MPINVYTCKCGFKEEYVESFSTSKDLWHPEICPNCNNGKLEKCFDATGIGMDFIGAGFYCNEYGKHAYKKNLSQSDQAAVLAGDMNPY